MPRLATFATVLAVFGLSGVGAASAGEFLHHPLLNCGNPAQVVQLPAQNIVVETTRPRIVLQDTAPVGKHGKVARVETPFVATILAPVAPMPPADARAADPTNLALAHQVEYSLMLLHRAQAAQEAERQATQRALDRVSQALRDTGVSPGGDPSSLAAQVKNLNERMDRLEKLVKIQSEVLRQQVDPDRK
jgi:hypothetical protein